MYDKNLENLETSEHLQPITVDVSSKQVRKFCGSRNGSVEDSAILGYDAASMGNFIPTFRRKVLPSSTRVDRSAIAKRPLKTRTLPCP